jgi:hypothetical protein
VPDGFCAWRCRLAGLLYGVLPLTEGCAYTTGGASHSQKPPLSGSDLWVTTAVFVELSFAKNTFFFTLNP